MNLNEKCLIAFLNNPSRIDTNLEILKKCINPEEKNNIIKTEEIFNPNKYFTSVI